jgi:hypothetical protein
LLGREWLAVIGVPLQSDGGIQHPVHFVHPTATTQHRRLARDDQRGGVAVGGDEQGGGVAAAEVFSQRGGDGRLEVGKKINAGGAAVERRRHVGRT